MAAIRWSEELSVEIGSIDSQHKKLIDLINSFYESVNKGLAKEKMLELIKALKDYTQYHFSNEERYMKQYGYPDFENHKKEHQQFIDTVLNFEERYKSGKLLLSLEVTNFIKDWVTNHILGTDKKYSKFFIQKGLKLLILLLTVYAWF
jgi:hemerythrin-like metal-binding protein